jgi:hypothetical protein
MPTGTEGSNHITAERNKVMAEVTYYDCGIKLNKIHAYFS